MSLPILMVPKNILMLCLEMDDRGVQAGAKGEWRGGPILVALLQIATQRLCYKFTRSMFRDFHSKQDRFKRGERLAFVNSSVHHLMMRQSTNLLNIDPVTPSVHMDPCRKSHKN